MFKHFKKVARAIIYRWTLAVLNWHIRRSWRKAKRKASRLL
jgi:hypothetical protein